MKYIQLYENFIKEDIDNKTIISILGTKYENFITLLGKHANDQKVINFLNLGLEDGIPNDEIINVNLVKIKATTLQPTQSQIGLKDSLGWLAENLPEQAEKEIKGDTTGGLDDNRVLIANNKYIIDGHHRWSRVFLFNPDIMVPCVNLDIKGFKNPTNILKVIQIAIEATYNNIPSTEANSKTDIFNDSIMSEENIRKILPEILGDKCSEICRKAYKVDTVDEVYDIITSNAMILKTYKPKNAPERKYMPQPADAAKQVNKDKSGFYGFPIDFIDKLKTGEINFKKPY